MSEGAVLHATCDAPGCAAHAVFHGDSAADARSVAAHAGWALWPASERAACPAHAGMGLLALLEKIAAVAALVLALLCTSCAAGRGWSRADTLAQVAFAAEIMVDEYQTAGWIAPHCLERNPVVGHCGERVPPAVYMAAAVVLETAVAWALPPAWRRWFEGVAVGVELDVVVGNWQTGRELRARGWPHARILPDPRELRARGVTP
jgi:hypothetical protein